MPATGKVARVVVDIALNREFDYLVPDELADELTLGSMVDVPFGRSRKRGTIVGFTDASSHANLKAILGRVGKKSLVDEGILKLARWMSTYYACPFELAVKAVLPSAVRRKGASFKEQAVVRLLPASSSREEREALYRRAPKQAAVLDLLEQQGDMLAVALAKEAGTTSATLRALEKKGLVSMGRQTVGRDPFAKQHILRTEPLELMEQQADALALIRSSMDSLQPPVVLLHGVTGSGKTEVYLQAIAHAFEQRKGAIVLVPEIALTPQTVERFRGRFGDDVAVLHSNLSDGERHDEWHRIHEGRAHIVVGARSALFAPVRNLGLVIVDEEHEPTYKQEEAPRYSARDVAVMRGHMEGCSVVLGSATPSLESFYNAQIGKYGMAHMPHRVDHRKMPAMRVIDMRKEKGKDRGSTIISTDLRDAIDDRVARAEQTLLFLNRRGFATSLICPACGYVAMCPHCSVSLTYHKRANLLCCHICGESQSTPAACPECNDPSYKFAGVGTQKVEAIVAKLFPKARVHRMDSDTMTRKDSYRDVLGKFKSGKIDILIGTQMIAKGLHFPNVTLVGVIFADLSLHMPDFRAGERTFQLLTQVAGRAGRGDITGEVVVQTFTPFHPAIQAARRMDFEGFYDQELEFRKELSYPPFAHVVICTIRGLSEEAVSFSAETFSKSLTAQLGREVIIAGPSPAPLAKAKGYYRYQILLRAPNAKSIIAPLREVLDGFTWPDKITCSVDVDPLSLL